MQIFTTRKPEPIFLTWKAETIKKYREERNVEGRNSSNQESGLNRELAGNNHQCKAISVSDSVKSTEGKESESQGDELKHRT